MLRTADLDISAGCVAEGVFTLCLFPVTVAVVQQSVREVGSCSLDVRIRCCDARVPQVAESPTEGLKGSASS